MIKPEMLCEHCWEKPAVALKEDPKRQSALIPICDDCLDRHGELHDDRKREA